jgi:HlyD family secretion protein
MKLLNHYLCLLLVTLLALLTGCTVATAQPELPTPTPLPPAPELERPTYTVERGSIARTLEATGRVSPVDQLQLAFQSDGRVAVVHIQRGDTVQTGMLLAELQQEEALAALRRAEGRLARAERDLELARARQSLSIRRAESRLQQARRTSDSTRTTQVTSITEAELALQRAEADLARLLPGGAADQQRAAAEQLAKTERATEVERDAASEAKTRAENALIDATVAVQNAQRAYSDAFWDVDWVRKYGTDPNRTELDPETGEQRHPDLNDAEIAAFETAFIEAEQQLAAAERDLELARRAVDLAREDEIARNAQADRDLAAAQEAHSRLQNGEGTPELAAAQRAVEDARLDLEVARLATSDPQAAVEEAALALEEARLNDDTSEQAALDEARLEVELAQRTVDAGRIVASQDGQILTLRIRPGDEVSAFEPVLELADPAQLEVSAELTGEQLRELAEGQPATLRLLARPDLALPALIRRIPAGSGRLADSDRTTRFTITDLRGLQLTLGAVARVEIVLEQKDGVLLLPPEAIRAFEGRRFVVVREGLEERRVPVRTGIETAERVEILEGLAEGDLVVGP